MSIWVHDAVRNGLGWRRVFASGDCRTTQRPLRLLYQFDSNPPAGLSARHWGQINRALIRLNAPHFTASHSFAVKHCCMLWPRGASDWQVLFVSVCVYVCVCVCVCVCVQSWLRAHPQSIFNRYHHGTVSLFSHGVNALLSSSFMYCSCTLSKVNSAKSSHK